MKFSRKKKTRPERNSSDSHIPESDRNFYEQGGGYTPLDGSSPGGGFQAPRTVRTAARRRENNTRATDKSLIFLVIKIFLIPLVLLLAYVGLKMLLDRLSEPSEKDMQIWEENSKLMERSVTGVPDAALVAEEIFVDRDFLERRLDEWGHAEQLLRSAEALSRRGIDADAIERLKQALAFAPNFKDAQQMLLDIYMKTEAYSEAAPICIQLLDQDSDQREIKLSLLKSLLMTEELQAALLLANQILVTEPNSPDALEVVAYVQAVLGNTQEALDVYAHILSYNKDHQLALSGSAYIYQNLGKWTNAIPYYSELIRLEAKPDVYHALAQCYAQLGEGGKATIYMGQAVSLYGEATVSPWLQEKDFDRVRETIEFRSFVDMVVGSERRMAIEEIRRREAEKEKSLLLDRPNLPDKPDLDVLKPHR